ncbi:MAG: hypothetical protein KAV00_13460, partial [Phycisphaerae bacterium]|nr:hypothetical protein [Phycisphaerae bacterium]
MVIGLIRTANGALRAIASSSDDLKRSVIRLPSLPHLTALSLFRQAQPFEWLGFFQIFLSYVLSSVYKLAMPALLYTLGAFGLILILARLK